MRSEVGYFNSHKDILNNSGISLLVHGVYSFLIGNAQYSHPKKIKIKAENFCQEFTVEVGDIITGRGELARRWKVDKRSIQTAIDQLVDLGIIQILHSEYALLIRINTDASLSKSRGGVLQDTGGGVAGHGGGVLQDTGGGVAGHPIEKEEKKNYKNKEPKPLTQKESSLKMDHSEEMTRIANKWDSIKGVRKTGIISDSKLQVLLANAIESEIDLDKVCEAQEKFGTKGTTLNSLLNPNADFVLKQHLEKLDNAPQTRKRRPL